MAAFFTRLSIKARLLLLAASSVGAALSITFLALLAYNVHTLRNSAVEQLQSQARMLGFNSTAVIAFQDSEAGNQLLAALTTFPSVDSAYLVDADGAVIATYPAGFINNQLDLSQTAEHEFTDDGFLLVRQPIIESDETIGTLILRANLDGFYAHIRDCLLILGGVVLLSLSLSIFLSLRLQRAIATPIARLVKTAKTITEHQDYSTRVGWRSHNELGHLCSTFDQMLDQIQAAKDQLVAANDDLERRVEVRTAQLKEEVNERTRVSVDLEKAKDAAEAANRAKSEFLANMSHEIRTPLNGLLGFTNLLTKQIDCGNTAVCHEYLETIESCGDHLLVLINDILDVSKIEAGQLEVECIPFSPHEVLSQVTSVFRAQAQQKGLNLEYRWTTPIPVVIQTDPERLRQLLMNLVGNAVKFTDKGAIFITARLDEEQEEIVIAVKDTGIGIAPDKQEMIFDPFAQADTSVTRQYGGTGLGLAISCRLARALGGDLDVASQAGQGATFTVRVATGDLTDVELCESTDADALALQTATARDRENSNDLSGSQILVVEDGPTNRKLVRAILEEAGATVTLAENGQVGWERGRSGVFDLILMDMQMPVMDGYTAATRLRESGISTPIIALTAHAMKDDEDKCRQAGCSGYLSKPIDIEELLNTMAIALRDAPHPSAEHHENFCDHLDEGEGDLGDAVEASPPYAPCTDGFHCTLPLDQPIYREIVDEFIDDLPKRLDSMRAALQSDDLDQLADVAHGLKGAAGSLGYSAFTDPCRQLEQAARARKSEMLETTLQQVHKISRAIHVPARVC